jgi:hypothetical protein
MPLPRRAWWTVLALAAMSAAGCDLIESTTSAPVSAVMAIVPGSKSGAVDLAALQTQVHRYADEFISRNVFAIEEYARLAGTDEARSQADRWKLAVATSGVSLATGPNPIAGVIDLAAISTLIRSVLEDHWVKTEQGAAFQPWLDASRHVEDDAWKLVDGILDQKQQAELRQSIRDWQEANPGARLGFFARPQDFTGVLHEASRQKKEKGGLITLLGLDPVSGLDPAVREVTQTRLFAERAMFMIQRLPFMLRGHVEFLVDEVTSRPKVEQAMSDVSRLTESADRISRATESASQTAAQLPDRITAEREAILAALETQEGKLRELSAEIGRTVGAIEKMSGSLNVTITTFDGLMKRFGVGEPKEDGPPDPDSKPFDVLDYARTAEQVAAMAKELDVLIKDATGTLDAPALDRRIKDLGAVAERASADVTSLVNRVFLFGAGLIVLAFACAFVYRWLVPRAAKARAAASVGR